MFPKGQAMRRQVPIGVLISGSGTNLQSIIDAIEGKELEAKIQVVLSNRADAYGLVRAKKHGIPVEVLDHKRFASREAFDQAVVDILRAREVELVVLAGFMRLLSPVFVIAYSNRIMNIHPALLPAFPGLHVQKKAVEHGARFSGCGARRTGSGGGAALSSSGPLMPVNEGDSRGMLYEPESCRTAGVPGRSA